MALKKQYSFRLRVWLDSEDGPFLGNGRVLLLQKISETGSITRAAKELKMSYRQAWQLIEDMNKRATEPLVEKQLGGKGGGGATVTPAGKRMIKKFYALEEKVKTYLSNEARKLKF